MLARQTVLQLVQEQGPVLPKDIARTTRSDLLIVSAMLSELVGAKKIKYSHLKIGSSPLYYFEGQEQKLQNYHEKLAAPLQDAFKLLKEQKIVLDARVSPQVRAALRTLKDFAHPFTRSSNGGKDLFWKWYLVNPDEATELVKTKYPIEEAPPPPPKPVSPPAPKKEVAPPEPEQAPPPSKPEPVSPAPQSEPAAPPPVQSAPEEKTEPPKEKPQDDPPKPQESHVDEAKQALEEMKRLLEEERKKLAEEREKVAREKAAFEKQKKFAPQEETFEDDPLYQQINGFLKEKNITINEVKIVKKGADFEGTTLIRTPVGPIPFLVHAKSKKRLTKKEFEALHAHAAQHNKQLLVLLQSDLPAKTRATLEEEFPLLSVLSYGSQNN